MKFKTKTILNIDSPTRAQIKKAFETNYHQPKNSALIFPRHFTLNCEGCGKVVYKDQTEKYYSQDFCKKCVEQWKAGY